MNRTIGIVAAAVVILAGAGYFIFMGGPGGDRVSGEELRAYVENQLTEAGATFEAITYDGGSDSVTVTNLEAGNAIPFYKEFKVATVTIKGGDKTAFEMLIDGAAAEEAGSEDFLRVAKEMRAEDITFTLDAGSMAEAAAAASGEEQDAEIEAEIDKAVGGLKAGGSIESFSVEDYAVKPTGESLATLLEAPDLSSPEALNSFMARAGKFGAAQKYDRYEVKGLTYQVDAEEANLEATVESATSDGYDAGILGETEVGRTVIVVGGEAIQEELGGPVTASMEGAIVERLDMAGMLKAMQDGTLVPEDPEKAPLLSAWTPTFGDYKVSNVKVSVPGYGDFTLEELSADEVKNVAGLALGGKGTLKNLVIPASAFDNSEFKEVFDRLGAEELRINISSKSAFDEKENVWKMSKFLVDVEKFGSLNTEFRFGGMGFLEDMVGMPSDEFVSSGMMNRVLQQMTFQRLQLTYRDQGAVDYLLNSMAEQSGMERSQLVQQYVQQFDAMRAQFGEVQALNELSGALASFMQEPKSLTLTFDPEEPVPFGQVSAMGMAAPTQLIEALGFSAEANK
ncbi:MAG: hypothetical protein ACLFWF_03365 [Alphaproteobacteria bacterium]